MVFPSVVLFLIGRPSGRSGQAWGTVVEVTWVVSLVVGLALIVGAAPRACPGALIGRAPTNEGASRPALVSVGGWPTTRWRRASG
jgi:hypothetical protein